MEERKTGVIPERKKERKKGIYSLQWPSFRVYAPRRGRRILFRGARDRYAEKGSFFLHPPLLHSSSSFSTFVCRVYTHAHTHTVSWRERASCARSDRLLARAVAREALYHLLLPLLRDRLSHCKARKPSPFPSHRSTDPRPRGR